MPKAAVDAPDFSWLQSADRPAPFYVVDSQKISSGEKLLWLRQELGSDASFEDFAVKFIELFGSNLRGKIPQKKAVLELYALYTETDIAAKESQLAPPERTRFKRIWDKHAPSLCDECGQPLGSGSKQYCSNECRDAGLTIACRLCGTSDQLEDYYCNRCQRGGRVAETSSTSSGDPRLDDQKRQLRMAQRVWWTTTVADPEHEPAWKRQRRS